MNLVDIQLSRWAGRRRGSQMTERRRWLRGKGRIAGESDRWSSRRGTEAAPRGPQGRGLGVPVPRACLPCRSHGQVAGPLPGRGQAGLLRREADARVVEISRLRGRIAGSTIETDRLHERTRQAGVRTMSPRLRLRPLRRPCRLPLPERRSLLKVIPNRSLCGWSRRGATACAGVVATALSHTRVRGRPKYIPE